MRRSPCSKSARLARGFTLVELMAVVAITSILAAICITLARKHLRSAGTVEAVATMQALRAAEESFKAENGTYLDCSRSKGPVWYPSQIPSKAVYAWAQPAHPDFAWWNQLGYKRELTRFGFLANAGLPGIKFNAVKPDGSQLSVQMTKTYKFNVDQVAPEPWYVIQFKGDRDRDPNSAQAHTPVLGLITSFHSDVFIQDEDE
ncbi:MAG TPA: prepilin-type N-terminal cleavage/methylation domain-containing protein [Polyangiaceae bacterium]|nr:prepilin-type N-terminal cleavage/methylation domain-containing protein [Polyangiaceae bacterium]